MLAVQRFHDYADTVCQSSYADKISRPRSADDLLPAAVRGYFESPGSERGIVWRRPIR
jgi:hypothetical protein